MRSRNAAYFALCFLGRRELTTGESHYHQLSRPPPLWHAEYILLFLMGLRHVVNGAWPIPIFAKLLGEESGGENITRFKVNFTVGYQKR